MKLPILLLLSVAILAKNGCFGQQRTTPHSGQRTTTPQGGRTTTRPRTTTPAIRGGTGQSGKLVNASPVQQTTARPQSANIVKAGSNSATTRTTPRSNGKVTTTTRANAKLVDTRKTTPKMTTRTTARLATTTRKQTTTTRTTTRTTQKNSKLVDARGTTPKITTRTTARQTSTTKKIQFVHTSVVDFRGPSTFGGPSFFGLPSFFGDMPFNWTMSETSVPGTTLSGNLTSDEVTESPEEQVSASAVNATSALDSSTSLSTTDDYGLVETSAIELTTVEPITGSTRKKLKRRIRIDAETGQRQIMKRRKVLKEVPEETEAVE